MGSWVMCELRNRSKSKAERARLSPETLSPQEGKASFKVWPRRLSLRADTTVTAASIVSETLFGHELSRAEKKLAGPAVHYLFGTTAGACYGLLAARFPKTRTANGLGYGAAVWLLADEVTLPFLSLARGPIEMPWRKQAGMLGLHLAFGLVVEKIYHAVA